MKKSRYDDQVMFSFQLMLARTMYQNGMYSHEEYTKAKQYMLEKYSPYISALLLDI